MTTKKELLKEYEEAYKYLQNAGQELQEVGLRENAEKDRKFLAKGLLELRLSIGIMQSILYKLIDKEFK